MIFKHRHSPPVPLSFLNYARFTEVEIRFETYSPYNIFWKYEIFKKTDFWKYLLVLQICISLVTAIAGRTLTMVPSLVATNLITRTHT